MAPVRSTRSSRLPQSPFSCTANRIRKRPASPISPLMSQQPPASRRSAFTYFPAQLIHDDNDDEDDADDSRHVYFPRNKRELFTRHIFPVSHASVEPGPLEGPEIDYAAFAFAEHDPALRVQYHAGLVPLLFKEAARIAERPEGSCFVSQTLAKRYESELAHSSEAMWEGEAVVRKVDMEAFRARKLGTSFDLEQELCRAANQHLVDPINAFCEESDNFEDMPPAFAWTGWQWADFDDHLGGLPTEWVGRYRGNTRAACRWKMGVTDEDMESLLAAGSGNVPPTWAHALHPGFYFSRAEGEDTPRSTDDRVTESAAKACVLAWSDMHRHRCRWHMIFNGRSAIVFYLARPDVLFVSDIIRHDAGERNEALTIALALLSLLILPVADRPTCTFNNEALRYHPCATLVAAARAREEAAEMSSSPLMTPSPSPDLCLMPLPPSPESSPSPPLLSSDA